MKLFCLDPFLACLLRWFVNGLSIVCLYLYIIRCLIFLRVLKVSDDSNTERRVRISAGIYV